MNFGQALLGQMLMGNSYSTPPRRFFKYNAATVNGVSRVQASGWMELQMAFGQMKRTDFSGPEFHNGAMQFMSAAGGVVPVGTTYPNHAYFGADFDGVPDGKYVVLRVKSVPADTPAAEAGVMPGDVVTAIAQKRFKNGEDLLDAAAKAAKTPTYPLELIRDGKTVRLQMNRAFRPAATTMVAAVPVVSATAVSTALPISMADELAKLGKLKAEGLLTQAEFDAAKSKLLTK